jgi:LPS-assembly lipoprotein
MIRKTVLVLLALVLSGCGFHLRSALVLPPDLGPLRIESRDPYSPLALSLEQALARAGAKTAAEGAEDVATLDLLSERWGNLPLSVDARGRAQEFTLRYAVVFELRGADGTVLVPRQAIELSRDYISVPTRSIGTESEREILARELRREMSAAVLRRIDAASRGVVGP